jgi:hypothetical protein
LRDRERERERKKEKDKVRYGEELTWFLRWRGDEDVVWKQLSGEEKKRMGEWG